MTVLAVHTTMNQDGPIRTTQNTCVKLQKARAVHYMLNDNNVWIYRVQYIVNNVMQTMDFNAEQYTVSIMRGE